MEAIPATRNRPPTPRIDRVLAVERTSGRVEGEGMAIPLSPQLAQILASLAAGDLTAAEVGSSPIGELAVRLPANAAMRIAHADLGELRSLSSASEAAGPALHWLDSIAAAELAAAVLAAHAAKRHLASLGDEVRDLKAVFAALPGKAMGGHEGRLRSLLQELTRYTRDARDSYAALIGKAAFRERIDEAGARALQAWHEVARLDPATRGPLDALSSTSRFGEVQVEKARSLLQEHRQAQRVQDVGARALAATSILRLVLGRSSDGDVDSLASALRSVQAFLEQDGLLQQRLRSAEAGARGDPYVGRGEFEANRAALRKLLDGLGSDLVTAHACLAAAGAAAAEGFPGAGAGWLCVFRLVDGASVELRVLGLEPV